MTQLTLTSLAKIEAAAEKATPAYWDELSALAAKESLYVDSDTRNLSLISLCDPATVAALCRVARVAFAIYGVGLNAAAETALEDALRDAGLIEP